MKITKINDVNSYLDNNYKLYSNKDYSQVDIDKLVDDRVNAIESQLFKLKDKKLRKKRQVRDTLFRVNEYIWNYIDKKDDNVVIEASQNFDKRDIVIKLEFLTNKKVSNQLKELSIEIIENSRIINYEKYTKLFQVLIDSRNKQIENLEELRSPIKKSLENQSLSVNFIDNEDWNNSEIKIQLNHKDRHLLSILDEMFNNGYEILEKKIFNNAKKFFELLDERGFIEDYLVIFNNKKLNTNEKLEKILSILRNLKAEKIKKIKGNSTYLTESQSLRLYVLNKVYRFSENRIVKMTRSRDYDRRNISNQKFEKLVMGAVKNNITQKILLIGKFMYYFSDIENKKVNKITSFDLEYISAVDKINLNLNTSLSQALKTLYVEVDSKFNKDILYLNKNNIYNKYKDENFIKKINIKLEHIFNKSDTNLIRIIIKNLYSLRNSILHYERTSSDKDLDYDFIEKIISDDIKSYNELIKEKFISNEVFIWYNNNELQRFIDKVYDNDSYSYSDKYIPSFSRLTREVKKVFSLEMNNELPESQINAKLFLLKEIYYNDFINKAFPLTEIIGKIRNEDKIEETAFPEFVEIIKERFNGDYIELNELAKYVLEKYNQLVNKRKTISDMSGEFIQINFKKIIVRAFKEYVEKQYTYIVEVKKELSNEISVDFFNINNPYIYLKNKKEVYPFYVMCKLLPQKELNNLIGNIKEYLQYIEDIREKASKLNVTVKNNKVIEETYIYQISNEMLDIAQFCLLSSGKVISRINDNYPTEQVSNRNQINRNLFLYLPEYVKIGDFEMVEIDQPLLGDESNITRDDLIKKIEYYKYKNYIDNIDELRLSNLYSDLYSHLLSLGVMIERDVIYFILASNYFINKDFKKVNKKRIWFMFQNDPKSINEKIKSSLRNNMEILFKKLMFNFSDYRTFRNELMHFNYFVSGTTQCEKNQKGVIHWYYYISNNLLKYDRKLKNSVTVRLIETFKKYQLDLKLSLSQEQKWKVKYLSGIKYGFKYQKNGVIKTEQLVTTSNCYQKGALMLLTGSSTVNKRKNN